jgi:hypothetical protein
MLQIAMERAESQRLVFIGGGKRTKVLKAVKLWDRKRASRGGTRVKK